MLQDPSALNLPYSKTGVVIRFPFESDLRKYVDTISASFLLLHSADGAHRALDCCLGPMWSPPSCLTLCVCRIGRKRPVGIMSP